MRNRWLGLLVFVIAVITPACRDRGNVKETTSPAATTATASRPAQLRDVSVRLDWTPWAPHAALYVAESRGYFRDEGLRVKLYVPPDPEATIQLVANGKDHFGISYMTDTILAREQRFDVVSIAAIVPHPLNCIMTLKKSGINDPSKLVGKTIGSTGIPSDEAYLDWIFERKGVPKESVKRVNLGFNLAPALTSGNVDAIVGAYWPWEGIKLEHEGHPVNVMKLTDYGVPDYYELVLITRGDLATKDPELVRKFARALVRGQEAVEARPDEAVHVLHSHSRDLTPQFLRASMHAMLPLMRPVDGRRFGQQQAKWSEMIEFMKRVGLIKKAIAAEAVFTDQFLPREPGKREVISGAEDQDSRSR